MIDPRLNDRGLSELERSRLADAAGLIPADHPQLWPDSALERAAERARIGGLAVVIIVRAPHAGPDVQPLEEYSATASCVDNLGTLTFRRDSDGFLGIAGAGAWRFA